MRFNHHVGSTSNKPLEFIISVPTEIIQSIKGMKMKNYKRF